MQARAPTRPPPAQRTRRRRALVSAASCSGTPTTLSDPPPRAQQQQPQQPPQLRQLYPFASPEGSPGTSGGGRLHSAPPPLLAGTLPAAAAAAGDDNHDGDDPSHRFYFEVRGNPLGLPALVLHGGPGAGSYPSHARFFDPDRYCVVLFDQRGCGRSSPLGALRGNTASAIVRDAERLRAHLGAPAWACVLGGSWGSALGLKYALDHPGSVRSLVLRAVCTMRPREEIGWLYRGGSGGGGGGAGPLLRPEAWRAFLAHVGMTPEEVAAGGEDPLPAYYERLLSDDLARRDAAVSFLLSFFLRTPREREREKERKGARWERKNGDRR